MNVRNFCYSESCFAFISPNDYTEISELRVLTAVINSICAQSNSNLYCIPSALYLLNVFIRISKKSFKSKFLFYENGFNRE